MTRHSVPGMLMIYVDQHPGQHALGDHQLLPLGLELLQLLGQLLGEYFQFTPASRDPLQLLHPPRALLAHRPGHGS
ncbi:hypothetical protein OG894_03380 [Streptomyces sp. NBC_01724]|uniref:hypothetical protein n=1 Tax=unclassified Streptomyces TaxID=2593676 RepID=UPI002E32FD25|nr:hypothetical protein [Streptomyces sp. NBC_01724]WTE56224.1 hypothetical protein OG987_39345 [Streptomyces sp. NBC_01620]WTE64298.1 hypothetical protein OG784_39085 [Streptomyces sp. NBC_01617]WTI91584.1 hypothetical protein OHB17_38405 [Streptomyces sp. NBC_00724]